MDTINLFVYGTLMSGFRANYLIPEESSMEKASIEGELYHYMAGFPIVKLSSEGLKEGTLNYDLDLVNQSKAKPKDVSNPSILGELYKIPFSKEILSMLDRYEGFDGSEESLYRRTLVSTITVSGKLEVAWVYNMRTIPKEVLRITTGNWREFMTFLF